MLSLYDGARRSRSLTCRISGRRRTGNLVEVSANSWSRKPRPFESRRRRPLQTPAGRKGPRHRWNRSVRCGGDGVVVAVAVELFALRDAVGPAAAAAVAVAAAAGDGDGGVDGCAAAVDRS